MGLTVEEYLERDLAEQKDRLYTLSFDKFVSEVSGREVGIHEIVDVKDIQVEEDLVFLFEFETEKSTSGYILIDLNHHKDPISIEVIEGLGLPNLSRV